MALAGEGGSGWIERWHLAVFCSVADGRAARGVPLFSCAAMASNPHSALGLGGEGDPRARTRGAGASRPRAHRIFGNEAGNRKTHARRLPTCPPPLPHTIHTCLRIHALVRLGAGGVLAGGGAQQAVDVGRGRVVLLDGGRRLHPQGGGGRGESHGEGVCVCVCGKQSPMSLVSSFSLERVCVKKAAPKPSAVLVFTNAGASGALFPTPLRSCVCEPSARLRTVGTCSAPRLAPARSCARVCRGREYCSFPSPRTAPCFFAYPLSFVGVKSPL